MAKRKYTLDEAREIILRERCEKRNYHMWSIKADPETKVPTDLYCGDCGEAYKVVPV